MLVAGCSAIARYRARERPRCAGSLTLCSLDDGLHRGSPRRLSTEVFATPSHHTSNGDHIATRYSPLSALWCVRPEVVKSPNDDHIATRYHLSRPSGDDAQRIASRSATDRDPPRPPLTRNASASFQTRPIPNRAHQPLGHSAGRNPHWPRHQHARGGLPQSTGRRPTNPRQAQSELLYSSPGTIHATPMSAPASDRAKEAARAARHVEMTRPGWRWCSTVIGRRAKGATPQPLVDPLPRRIGSSRALLRPLTITPRRSPRRCFAFTRLKLTLHDKETDDAEGPESAPVGVATLFCESGPRYCVAPLPLGDAPLPHSPSPRV